MPRPSQPSQPSQPSRAASFAASLIVAGLALTGLARQAPAPAPVESTESTGATGSHNGAAEKPSVGRRPSSPLPPASAEGSAQLRSAGRLPLNTATLGDLRLLPGVGPKLAQSILDDRQRNGPFASVRALARVRGVGNKTAERLSGMLTVSSPRPLQPPQAHRVAAE